MEIVDRVYVASDALEAVGRPGEIGAEQPSSVDVDVRFQQHRKRLALAEIGSEAERPPSNVQRG
jgi:hypothetical protein